MKSMREEGRESKVSKEYDYERGGRGEQCEGVYTVSLDGIDSQKMRFLRDKTCPL
jgi:hypothetical protein